MPSNVRNFVLLGYLGVAIAIVWSVFTFGKSAEQAAVIGGGPFVIIVQVITWGLLAVLVTLAGFERKNWARWVLLVLFLLGLPLVAPIFPAMLKSDPIKAAASALQTVMQGVALFLVFTGNARPWFRTDTPSVPLRGTPPP